MLSLLSCGRADGVKSNGKLKQSKNQVNAFFRFYVNNYIKTDFARLEESPAQPGSRCLSYLPDKINNIEIKWPTEVIDSSKWISAEAAGLNIIRVHKSSSSASKMPFYVISKPIISNDSNFVSIYWEYHCGDRSGKGGLEVFRRKGNLWE